MGSERIALEHGDGIATIRLTRGDAHNAIDARFVTEFAAAVEGATAPGAARAILVLADGPSFTVGGDINHFRDHVDDLGDELRSMIEPYHRALGALAGCALPVACAAQGLAAGGGLGILWASDIVIAGEDLKVSAAFARIALTGDGGWSYYLPRLVGLRRTLELVLENRALDAREAADWGIVTRVLPTAEIVAEARRVAEGFAAGPSLTLGHLRRLARAGAQSALHEQLADEVTTIQPIAATQDAMEATSAFLERRAPQFRGA